MIKLSLGMNRILSLPDIRYLKHLKVLRLESNGLRSLRTAALPESLVELRLCNNSISDMQSFDNLYNLRRLRLAGNTKIRNIRQSSLFRSQSALVELDLRDCSISGIDASAFACYPYLRTVELQGNQLREYNPMWFAFNQKIKRVSLSRNPWNCDCAFAQHLEDLAIVANNTRRIKSRAKRSVRLFFFFNEMQLFNNYLTVKLFFLANPRFEVQFCCVNFCSSLVYTNHNCKLSRASRFFIFL